MPDNALPRGRWSLFRGPTTKKKVVAARVAVKALVVREVRGHDRRRGRRSTPGRGAGI